MRSVVSILAIAPFVGGVAHAAPSVSACNSSDLATLGLSVFDTTTQHGGAGVSQPLTGHYLVSLDVPAPTSGVITQTFLVDGLADGEYILATVDTLAAATPTAEACTVIDNTAGDLDFLEVIGRDTFNEEYLIGGYDASPPLTVSRANATFSALDGTGVEDDYLNVGIFAGDGFDLIHSRSNYGATWFEDLATTDVAYYFSGGSGYDTLDGTDNWDCLLGDNGWTFTDILSAAACGSSCDPAAELLFDPDLDRQVLCWPAGPPDGESDANDSITGCRESDANDTRLDAIAGQGGYDFIFGDVCTPTSGYGHDGPDLIFGDYGFFGTWLDLSDAMATMDAGASGDDEIAGGCLDHLSSPTQVNVAGVGDMIAGGPGNDDIIGSDAEDVLHGEWPDAVNAVIIADGYNTLTSNVNDRIYGVGSADEITTGPGLNVVFGGLGGDDITGGDGTDILWGEDGPDTIDGEAGMDVILGGDGLDVLNGKADDDLICGGGDADTISGNNGDDVLYGDQAEDSDPSNDIDVSPWLAVMPSNPWGEWGCEVGAHDPTYMDDDYILLWGSHADNGDLMSGGNNDDVLLGGGGADFMAGNDGADVLMGDGGNDQVFGGNGDDVIGGNAGNDVLDGKANQDAVCDDDSGDTLRGGGADDKLFVPTSVTPALINGQGGSGDRCTATAATVNCPGAPLTVIPGECLAAGNISGLDVSP